MRNHPSRHNHRHHPCRQYSDAAEGGAGAFATHSVSLTTRAVNDRGTAAFSNLALNGGGKVAIVHPITHVKITLCTLPKI